MPPGRRPTQIGETVDTYRMEGFALIHQRGALARFSVVSVAFIAALVSVGAPGPAAAASSSATTRLAEAFPDDSFLIQNPSQQARCVMPTTPSFVGPLTLQLCGNLDEYFFSFTYDGLTDLLPLWGTTADGYVKCLVTDTTNVVSTKNCADESANTNWQLVGKTIRYAPTGKCLSANSAGAVYMATCDGAVNRDWDLPTSFAPASSEAARAAREARRAEVAGTTR